MKNDELEYILDNVENDVLADSLFTDIKSDELIDYLMDSSYRVPNRIDCLGKGNRCYGTFSPNITAFDIVENEKHFNWENDRK